MEPFITLFTQDADFGTFVAGTSPVALAARELWRAWSRVWLYIPSKQELLEFVAIVYVGSITNNHGRV